MDKFYKYILYFIIFTGLRFALWGIYGTNINPEYIIDGREYLQSGMNLEACPSEITGYEVNNWYERTPTYNLFLYLIRCNLIFQILLCGIAGTLAFKVNRWFGLYFLLYPNWVFQSFNYSKEALLIAMTLIAIYFLKDKPRYLFTAAVIINIGFLGYAQGLLEFNLAHSVKPMQGIWEIWKPSPDPYISSTIGSGAALILLIPFYLIKMWWFRAIKSWDISIPIVLGITGFFIWGWASARYAEIALPFMIYYIVKETGCLRH